METIFECQAPERVAHTQCFATDKSCAIDKKLLRESALGLPEASELDVVRHYTRLSQRNFSIDTHFYPLGSCTMKYNPRAVHRASSLNDFQNRHPLAPLSHSQGFLQCLYELQNYLKNITGMQGVSLSPMAGAQGELAGVAMIRAYHHSRGDRDRQEFLVPDNAHGTNPASAVMCGFKVKEIPTLPSGDLDLEALQAAVGPQTAGIMLTNPSTLGLFERHIQKVQQIVHQAGGLLYYDGANLNAILGRVRPGDMGFDVMHLNLHKTFATPHGGGGPGSGPVAVNEKLLPFLPVPMVAKNQTQYYWVTQKELPESIGRLSAFMGNAAILLRAYAYIRVLGQDGLHEVSDMACLNANYLMHRLSALGLELAYPQRRASHEFIVTFKKLAKEKNITAMDLAKRLLDKGHHAPTTYFPLSVPECWLIEPTETESKATLDIFIKAIEEILHEVEVEPERVTQAPESMPVTRLDEVKAARELDVVWEA